MKKVLIGFILLFISSCSNSTKKSQQSFLKDENLSEKTKLELILDAHYLKKLKLNNSHISNNGTDNGTDNDTLKNISALLYLYISVIPNDKKKLDSKKCLKAIWMNLCLKKKKVH